MPLLFFFKLIESEGTKLMFGLAGHTNNQYSTCFWMLIKSGKTEREAEEFLKVLIIDSACVCVCLCICILFILIEISFSDSCVCMYVSLCVSNLVLIFAYSTSFNYAGNSKAR